MRWSDFHILPDDESAKSIRNWRIRQAIVSCSSWAVVAFFILPALIGVPYTLPKIGQVAWASDTGDLKSELTEIKAQLLAQSINHACEVKSEAQLQGRHSPYWQEQVRKLRQEYYRLTGQSFELPPSC